MELVGNEERIRALFSELKLADEQAMPRFLAMWTRAQSRTIQPRRAFNFSFVTAIALLICALVSLVWWSIRWQRGQQSTAVVIREPVKMTAATAPIESGSLRSELAVKERQIPTRKRHVVNLRSRRQAELLAATRKATSDAISISKWQSPTVALMRSPSDEVLTSLPQLDQSATELKSFLLNRLN